MPYWLITEYLYYNYMVLLCFYPELFAHVG